MTDKQNQSPVVTDEIDDRIPIAATEGREVDEIDVSGWGVFKGHAIPIDVARYIAEKINFYHRYRLEAALPSGVRVKALIDAAEDVCRRLESETDSVTIFEQVALREALSAIEPTQAPQSQPSWTDDIPQPRFDGTKEVPSRTSNSTDAQATIAAKDGETERLRALLDRAVERMSDAETRVAELEKALVQARKRFRNARGAIESNQVVDKDVRGMMRRGMDEIDVALHPEREG